MSGIAGVCNLDGRLAQPALVEVMAAAIAHRGTADSPVWCAGPVALSCRLLRVTPESAGEVQPARDHAGNVLVFDGRLDDRKDLLAALRNAELGRDAPDSALVLAAWREWGDECLARLQGDFALVLFDAAAHTVILARDPVGCRALYYWSSGTTFVFASEIKAILAHPDVRAKPNEDLVADLFLLERLPYGDEGDTFFQGIRAVRPGWRLSVTREGTAARRFWDFNPRTQLRYRSHADYASRLRELLVNAVARRLRTSHPVVVATSGGLDSSIVLAIADDLRERDGRAFALLPVSYAPVDDPTTEENRFIHLLESARGLRVHRLAPGACDDPEQLRRAAWHSESLGFVEGTSAQWPLLQHAHAAGARTLLTGLWSDHFMFVTGYLTDLSRRLAWREVARHLAEYRRWFPDADPGYFRKRFQRELLSNLTPRAARRWLSRLRATRPRTHQAWPISDRLEARVRRRRPAARHPRYASVHARTIYQTARGQSHRLQIEADEKVMAAFGLEHATPFLDRDVITYLMSVPGDVLNRGGVPRALLRDAMAGLVPAEILRRRWRNDSATPAALERDRRQTALAFRTELRASHALGYLPDVRYADLDSVDLVGLEVWSQVFFSDTLHPAEEGPTMPAPTRVSESGEKLPYSPPTLTIHGSLQAITAAGSKGGNHSDSGNPKTWSNSAP
ncbi:MAG: hypothetical protein V7647_4184 [Acidobacteriota bacterium]